MALGAVLATALTDRSARYLSLYLNGLNIIGSTGSSYGVDPASVQVTEQSAGGVSGITFSIDDPLRALYVGPGMELRLHDHARDMPVFLGWVERIRYKRLGGGRTITVTGVGIESALDWMIVPGMTIAAGTRFMDGVTRIIAAAGSVGVSLNTATNEGTKQSTRAYPIGTSWYSTATLADIILPTGTLRTALETYCQTFEAGYGWSGNVYRVTVDFYSGLRMWIDNLSYTATSLGDYDRIELSDELDPRPSDTSYEINNAGSVRFAYVVGANANGTGFVSPGYFVSGVTAVINDDNATTAAIRDDIAKQYIARNGGASVFGSVVHEDSPTMGDDANQKRAGSILMLREFAVGLDTATPFRILSIGKTWTASLDETWTIEYGEVRTYGTSYLRRLTREKII